MFHANILARAVKVLLGIPIVSTIHSEIECSHRKKSATTREWIYRLTNLVCGRVTAVSERVRERYVREKIIPANCIEVVGNGVDLDRIHPVPERRHETRSTLGWNHTFVWLAVGRLELAKDYPTLIRAFLTIRQRFPEARLVIAGDGRLRKQLEEQIQVASAESAICLLGWRDDIPSLVNACDALVMSSSWEGAQLAVLEAGAAERAVVATAVGVAPQAVVAGKTGFLVPPGDAAALAEAMADLMKLPTGELRDMGREARKHVANGFSLQSAIHHYLRVYREVLEISR